MKGEKESTDGKGGAEGWGYEKWKEEMREERERRGRGRGKRGEVGEGTGANVP